MADVILVHEVMMNERDKIVQGGELVYVGIKVVKQSFANGNSFANPSEPPKISVINQDGQLVVINRDMGYDDKVGFWSIGLQTLPGDSGYYSANFTVLNDGIIKVTSPVGLYKVSGSIPVASFSYFVLRDQEGTARFYFINKIGEIDFRLTIPQESLHVGIDVIVEDVYWLVVVNDAGAVRYLMPEVTGELTASVTQPAIGQGTVFDSDLTALGGQIYNLDLNITDEIEIREV